MGRPVIYLDANVIIRLVEGAPAARQLVEARIMPANPPTNPYLTTCALSRIECRCKPLGAADLRLVALYDTFFAGSELSVIPIDSAVIEEATRLRAVYNFKTPDALHVAAALVAGCTAFLTGDRQLARCTELAVDIV